MSGPTLLHPAQQQPAAAPSSPRSLVRHYHRTPLTSNALHLAQHAVSSILVGQHKRHGADALRVQAQVLRTWGAARAHMGAARHSVCDNADGDQGTLSVHS